MALLPAIAAADDAALLPPTVVVCGPGARTDVHAHHGMHVVLARGGQLSGIVHAEGAPVAIDAAGIWIAPNVPHSIDGSGLEVAMLFIDPESREGAALRRSTQAGFRPMDDRTRDALLDRWPGAQGASRDEAFTTAALAALGIPRHEPRGPVHPAVLRALRLMREVGPPPTLPELASASGLSAGRLLHVFTEAVGIPPRRYLLWLKVNRASQALASGASITEAAHEAGFSDSAHLSRTFRRMFGTTPRGLVRNSQIVQAGARPAGL